jgi:hypothetical protein
MGVEAFRRSDDAAWLALLDRWWELEPELPDFFDFIDGAQPAAHLLTPEEVDVANQLRAGEARERFPPTVLDEIDRKAHRWRSLYELGQFLRGSMKQPGTPDEPDTGEEE